MKDVKAKKQEGPNLNLYTVHSQKAKHYVDAVVPFINNNTSKVPNPLTTTHLQQSKHTKPFNNTPNKHERNTIQLHHNGTFPYTHTQFCIPFENAVVIGESKT